MPPPPSSPLSTPHIHEVQCLFRTAQAVSAPLSQARLKHACSSHEELCGVGVELCHTSQRQYCVCKCILLPLSFWCVSVFVQRCDGQNQHLLRNGMAADSDLVGKKTRPARCRQDKWCLVHTRMQVWPSRSSATGQSCLCF